MKAMLRHSLLLMSIQGMILTLCWFSQPHQASAARRCRANSDCGKGFVCVKGRCKFNLTIDPKKRKSAYVVGIAPVRWFGPTQKHPKARVLRQIEGVLQRNFSKLPGLFKILPRKASLEVAPLNGIEIGTFSFLSWQKAGANGLIKIGVSAKDKRYLEVRFRYYDVDASRQTLRMDRTVALKQLNWQIKLMMNAAYRYVTRSPGMFTSQIAYVRRNYRGGKDIWVMDFDGSNQRCVIRNGRANLLPRWSPDGRYLYFTSYMKTAPYLYRLNLQTAKIQPVSRRRGNYTGVSFAPNGKRMSFSYSSPSGTGGTDLFTANLDGTGMKRVTKGWGIDLSATWSPDGKQIAFVSDRFADPHIFLMNADGSAQTRLTYKGNYNQEPRWSPTAPEILFTGRDEFLKYDLFVIKLEKEGDKLKPTYRRLTQGQGKNYEASWSPDGRFIIFVSTRYGERKIFIMGRDGTRQKVFSNTRGDFSTPVWGPPLKARPPSHRHYYKSTRLLPFFFGRTASSRRTPARPRPKVGTKPARSRKAPTVRGRAKVAVGKKVSPAPRRSAARPAPKAPNRSPATRRAAARPPVRPPAKR